MLIGWFEEYNFVSIIEDNAINNAYNNIHFLNVKFLNDLQTSIYHKYPYEPNRIIYPYVCFLCFGFIAFIVFFVFIITQLMNNIYITFI